MIAGYVRLSRDDDRKNYISIENQKLIIEQFTHNRGMVIDRWYEDDGVSGYSLDRPGFTKLLYDLEKDVDIIIAKDLSRIGRHNAKVLLLLDQIKEQGKRLLLVDDDYDTYKDNDDIIGIKTWYNERYVKDTSKKIKRVLRAKQVEGTLAIGVPFGYRRNQKNKNEIEIVDEEAYYVKYIYDLYLNGYGYRKISEILTKEGIPTPSMFLKERYAKEGKAYNRTITYQWSDSMVSDILKNDFYIGNLRLHKRERTTINGTDHRVPDTNHLLFEGNHEAIIEKHTYELVQHIMKKRIKSNYRGQKNTNPNVNYSNIFGGCLFCKDCGSKLTPIVRSNRKYYICNTYNAKGKQFCAYPHLIEEADLQEDIRSYIKLCKDALCENIKTYHLGSNDKVTVKTRKEHILTAINNTKKQLKTLLAQRIKELADNPENEDIINEVYKSLQKDILENLHLYEQQLFNSQNSDIIEINEGDLQNTLLIMDYIIKNNSLDRKDVEILIDKIIVDKKGMSEIILRFGLCDYLKGCPNQVLNKNEIEILKSIFKILYKSNRTYTSLKYLSSELTILGFKKSKKGILAYIQIMIDMGILKPTDNKLAPYQIFVTKNYLKDIIDKYKGVIDKIYKCNMKEDKI